MAQLKDLIVNGPSRFIGDVYATTFTGDLNGNANTATSATTAAALTGKTLVTASAVTTSNWSTYGNNHIPTMSFMAYWNGAYSGTSSNLTYCAQGTIIGSNNIGNQSVKYATTSGSCNGNAATATKATQDGNGKVIADTYLPLSGGTIYPSTGAAVLNLKAPVATKDSILRFSDAETSEVYEIMLRRPAKTYGLQYNINGTYYNLIHAGNYNSYSPKLDGTGATGAWGINITGNAATATTATTANKIGTSTIGSSTMPVYIKSGAPTAITSFPESYLSWGGKNFSGSYGPIDAAMIPDLGSCRSMFAKAAGITVQYSRNGGSTWVDYGLTDTQKTALFSVGQGIVIGGTTETGIDKSNYKSRVIVTTNLAGIYTMLNKIAIYVSTNGSSGCNVTIDARTKANVDAGNDTWTTLADSVPVNGWSGWNIINIPSTTTYGNTSNQYQQIRFTFNVTSHASTVTYPGLSVSRIMMFGGAGWVAPSNMARNGHLYSYDAYQNAEFPAAVKATNFRISGGTSAQFLKADGSVDSNTYSKSGHTHTKSQITDFPTSLPASDVYSWAKQSTKPSYTGTEVTLSGYSKNTSYTPIASGDSVQAAIAKLEGAINGLEDLLASI